MNNNTPARSAIQMYAHALRQNRATIIDEYTCLIENELGRIFPVLKEKSEDGIQDCACDIINCDSKQEVDATLDRINDILTDQAKVESNLNIKNRSQSDPNSVLDTQRRVLCELETQLTKIRNILNEIEYDGHIREYDEYHHITKLKK